MVAALHAAGETTGDVEVRVLDLAVAVHDNEVLGGNLFFEHGGIMHTHLQSTKDGQIWWADKLLYHEVRRWGRARGNRIYHLGGGLGGNLQRFLPPDAAARRRACRAAKQ